MQLLSFPRKRESYKGLAIKAIHSRILEGDTTEVMSPRVRSVRSPNGRTATYAAIRRSGMTFCSGNSIKLCHPAACPRDPVRFEVTIPRERFLNEKVCKTPNFAPESLAISRSVLIVVPLQIPLGPAVKPRDDAWRRHLHGDDFLGRGACGFTSCGLD